MVEKARNTQGSIPKSEIYQVQIRLGNKQNNKMAVIVSRLI
jgi:hypothetical protein